MTTPTDQLSPHATLYRADCRRVIPHLSGPLYVLTDPPYGVKLTQAGSRADRGGKAAFCSRKRILGDEDQSVGAKVIWLCRQQGWPVAAFAQPEKLWPGDWRQVLTWDKGEAVGVGGDRKTCWKRTIESIQVGRFPEVFGDRDEAILRFPVRVGVTRTGERLSPYSKPVKLMRYLVQKLVPEDGIVLDPFMGYGSTAIACIQLGRPFIGIERDPEVYAAACDRLRAAVTGGPLFAHSAALFT